jgi:hypothetical protein
VRLPVDTSAMVLVAMATPEPVVDFTTRQPKADPDGQPATPRASARGWRWTWPGWWPSRGRWATGPGSATEPPPSAPRRPRRG